VERCRTIAGVAVLLERFYKLELDAAHNPRPQATRPGLADGVLIPLPGITRIWDFLT
jgi:hypothetical protein